MTATKTTSKPQRRRPKLSDAKREEMNQAYLDHPTIEHVRRTCRVNHLTAKKYCGIDGWDKLRADLEAQANKQLIKKLSQKRVSKIVALEHYLGLMSADLLKKKKVKFGSTEYDRLARLIEFLERDAVEDKDSMLKGIKELLGEHLTPDQQDAAIERLK